MQDQLWDAGPVKIMLQRGQRSYPTRETCREPGCTNPARQKQGARYCLEHARAIDYELLHPKGQNGAPAVRTCPGCERRFTHRRATHLETTKAWSEFCPDCHNETPLTLDQLRAHRVGADLVRKWLMLGAKLPCDICGKTLTRRNKGSHPLIDHDHNHCRGGNSCGECVRGVLCMDCNTKVGHAEGIDRAGLWDVLRAYLQPRKAQQPGGF